MNRFRGATLITAVLVALLVPAGSAESQSLTLAGTATAEGGRFTYRVPDFLVAEDLMDGGGPVAHARVDSTGQSTSFASLPYPGELGVAGPALLGTVLGQAVPATYPFYVYADYPSQPKEEKADPSGLYRLRSVAGAGEAAGLAAFASPDGAPLAGGSVSRAGGVLGPDGTVTMTASAVNTLLSFGNGTLRIAFVESSSQTVLEPGETSPVTTTKLVIEGARVGDQSVTIGPDGIRPATTAVNEALKAGGISVHTVSTDGVEILEVVSTHPLPFPGSPKGTAIWRFGGARTAIKVG